MHATPTSLALARLFGELTDGAAADGGAFILNSGDRGLLRTLDAMSATDASRAVDGGATVAAHAQHLRDGLSLMNRWAQHGGDPFADASWDAAWRITVVDAAAWEDIRRGLRDEARQWCEALSNPRPVSQRELAGAIASIAHVAYHLGAIRQIVRTARGPSAGTFPGTHDRAR